MDKKGSEGKGWEELNGGLSGEVKELLQWGYFSKQTENHPHVGVTGLKESIRKIYVKW